MIYTKSSPVVSDLPLITHLMLLLEGCLLGKFDKIIDELSRGTQSQPANKVINKRHKYSGLAKNSK